AIPSYRNLLTRGEAVIKEAKLDSQIRLSTLFSVVFSELELTEGRDDGASAAIIISHVGDLQMTGFAAIGSLVERVVYAVALADPKAALGADSEDKLKRLLAGEIVESNGNAAALNRGHLVVGGPIFLEGSGNAALSKKNVERVLAGPSLAQLLGADAPTGDLWFHLGPKAWGHSWESIRTELHSDAKRLEEGPRRTLMAHLAGAADDVRVIVAGVTLSGGIDIAVTSLFEKGKAASSFLQTLRAGSESADLKGLPNRAPLLAFGARGDGSKNQVLLEGAMAIAVDALGSGNESYAAMTTIIGPLWGNLNGSRGALYAGKTGLPSLVLVVDTDVPNAIAQALRKLGNGALGGDDKIVWNEAAQTIEGVAIGHLKLSEVALDGAGAMIKDFTTARLAVVGKQVVLQAGPDIALLRETISNLKKSEPGLASNAVVRSAQNRLRPEAQAVVLASVSRLANFGGEMEPVTVLSGTAITVQDDRLMVDIWVPSSEIAAGAL
ncbi:MAG: hypothetical protein ACI9OJ_004735, partial [Myxococcota bacterium]